MPQQLPVPSPETIDDRGKVMRFAHRVGLGTALTGGVVMVGDALTQLGQEGAALSQSTGRAAAAGALAIVGGLEIAMLTDMDVKVRRIGRGIAAATLAASAAWFTHHGYEVVAAQPDQPGFDSQDGPAGSPIDSSLAALSAGGAAVLALSAFEKTEE